MFNFLALISEFLVAYITIVASDWPRTFLHPRCFCLALYLRIYTYIHKIFYIWLSNTTILFEVSLIIRFFTLLPCVVVVMC